MPAQLWETTLDPQRRLLKQMVVEDAAETNVVFSSLMGARVSRLTLKPSQSEKLWMTQLLDIIIPFLLRFQDCGWNMQYVYRIHFSTIYLSLNINDTKYTIHLIIKHFFSYWH